jgi:hypothetical protein
MTTPPCGYLAGPESGPLRRFAADAKLSPAAADARLTQINETPDFREGAWNRGVTRQPGADCIHIE